jgi:hypothetical protein
MGRTGKPAEEGRGNRKVPLVISPCPDRGANTKKKKKNIYLFFNFIGKEDSRSPKAPNLRCTIIPPPFLTLHGTNILKPLRKEIENEANREAAEGTTTVRDIVLLYSHLHKVTNFVLVHFF